jgi:hypothetical protein
VYNIFKDIASRIGERMDGFLNGVAEVLSFILKLIIFIPKVVYSTWEE